MVAAIVELFLRFAALLAIGMIVWAGIQFISSQGEADGVAKAKQTMINALMGLLLAVIATAAVSFVAGSVK